jgi:tetrapyrrole methylase family protein/MazG family protein
LAKPVDRLIGLVARLRSPKGCPWDRKQTHLSLIKFLHEEARELEEALRRGRWHEIEDELGDLLLQVLLHAQIAQEEGLFDIQDVAWSQYRKLVRRHPHVFGRRKLRTAAQVLGSWAEIKRKERSLRLRDVQRRRPVT